MMQRIGLVLVMFVLLAGYAVHAETQVQAQVDRSRPIYAGSRFSYSIIVINGEEPEAIDLDPLKTYQPSNPSPQSRISTVNGRTTRLNILTYQLLADREGQYNIPSISVKVSGKTYRTNPINISIVAAGTTKQIDVEIKLSTQECYVGQPIVLTMSFYVWMDIVRAKQITNIDIQIPFLEEGLFETEDTDFLTTEGAEAGLPINGRQEPVYQDQVRYKGVDCVRVQYIKALIPRKAGTFELQPASVTADLAVGRKKRSRDPFFDDFFSSQYKYERFGAQSNPLKLEIKELPRVEKPKDFYGLVGNYTITATADPKEVNVGDPITLTIQIGGSQYLKTVQWPELKKILQFAESFKIPSERSDGQIQANAKVFTQTIRPSHENVKQIPPIPLSFFDTKTGQYHTIYSKPIPLNVAPTRIVTGADVQSMQLAPQAKQIKAIREGLSANYTTPDALINQRFSPLAAITSPLFIFLYTIPFVGMTASAVMRFILADSPQRQAAQRRRNAYSHAVKLLRQAFKHEKPSEQACLALKQYFADKFSKSAGSLTAQDCSNLVHEKTGDSKLSGFCRETMEQFEESEYSLAVVEFTLEKQKEILGLLARIEKKAK